MACLLKQNKQCRKDNKWLWNQSLGVLERVSFPWNGKSCLQLYWYRKYLLHYRVFSIPFCSNTMNKFITYFAHPSIVKHLWRNPSPISKKLTVHDLSVTGGPVKWMGQDFPGSGWRLSRISIMPVSLSHYFYQIFIPNY